jgi:hypothetical protein
VFAGAPGFTVYNELLNRNKNDRQGGLMFRFEKNDDICDDICFA